MGMLAESVGPNSLLLLFLHTHFCSKFSLTQTPISLTPLNGLMKETLLLNILLFLVLPIKKGQYN